MNPLTYIVEPIRLLLTWQPTDEEARSRTRRTVAEVGIDPGGQAVFRYLKGSSDFEEAQKAGFQGFPAFPLEKAESREGVLEVLMRRLPPHKREDFAEYLRQHRLPVPFTYSDLTLLGYTGARLPSDGFALVPVFPPDAVPCDFLTEVAGLRHTFNGDIAGIRIGDPVAFEIDSENPVDQDALAVMHQGRRIGYINRALKETFHHWLRSYVVNARIERLNGKPTRPLVHLRVHVTACLPKAGASPCDPITTVNLKVLV
ncbi:MAG: HIRAN domain-containing protein [Gammaproteobacteria bacterium]